MSDREEIERLVTENNKLKTYIIELKSFIRLVWDYLPTKIKERIRELEDGE